MRGRGGGGGGGGNGEARVWSRLGVAREMQQRATRENYTQLQAVCCRQESDTAGREYRTPVCLHKGEKLAQWSYVGIELTFFSACLKKTDCVFVPSLTLMIQELVQFCL